ncbi:hypothetical protein MKZ38_005468 [Zalerion maritima]|uniref:PARP catalytic domain-containing protein n=1 Tax=Zalerion maritima TaxID=339359 RepID=A0AAD5RKL8_9PEZI|nr:hypothetical protein MKZ38_005468 [Zalerion maritima]
MAMGPPKESPEIPILQPVHPDALESYQDLVDIDRQLIDDFFEEDERIQLSLLRDEETDLLISNGILDSDWSLSHPLEKPLLFRCTELVLTINPGKSYPVLLQPLKYSLQNLSLSRVPCDDLRYALNAICDRSVDHNSLSVWLAREEANAFGIFEPSHVVLDLVKETLSHLHAYRKARAKPETTVQGNVQKKAAWTALSAGERAHEILGPPKDITKGVPSNYRVLHVEEIIRHDLANKYLKYQANLRDKLESTSKEKLIKCVGVSGGNARKEDLVEELLKPKVTFHGTPRQNVPSIVRHGFFKPGSKIPKESKANGEKHEVQHGSTYGRGIYSSPSPSFALSYSGYYCEPPSSPSEFFGLKLIVCATLMGRPAAVTRDDNWRCQYESYPGSDSHVANNKFEFIVFDSAAILPVYVIHLDWGNSNSDHVLDIPKDPRDWVKRKPNVSARRIVTDDFAAGDKKRAREAALARAKKYFPYGYGPATGGRFVVEEIGEVSEDEEDYGDYQAMRGDEAEGNHASLNFWSWVKAAEEEGSEDHIGGGAKLAAATWKRGGSLADEYSEFRKLGRDDRPVGPEWEAIPLPPKPGEEERYPGEDDDEDMGLGFLMLGE